MSKRKSPSKPGVMAWLLIPVLVLAPAVTWAAFDAYLYLTGEIQGAINGDVDREPYVGSIKVVGFGHNLSSVLDSVTGLPSGKRQHRPLRIVKEIDSSTPILLQVWSNDETLTGFTLRFVRPDPQSGADDQFYTIELLNARIVSIMPSHSSVLPDSAQADPDPMYETVTFTYSKITVTWEDGGITGASDWTDPRP